MSEEEKTVHPEEQTEREPSDLELKLDEAVKAHNQLHEQITQGEQQLTAMRAQRDRLLGRVQVLDELVNEEKAKEQPLPGDE